MIKPDNWSHASYPTDSPTATRLGLCSSLSAKSVTFASRWTYVLQINKCVASWHFLFIIGNPICMLQKLIHLHSHGWVHYVVMVWKRFPYYLPFEMRIILLVVCEENHGFSSHWASNAESWYYYLLVAWTNGGVASAMRHHDSHVTSLWWTSLVYMSIVIVRFYIDFSPSGEQPEQRKSAHTLYIYHVEQCSTNSAAIQTWGY